MSAPPDIVDWSVALRIGRRVAGPGPATTPDVRAGVRKDFAELSARADGLVRAFTGIEPSDAAPPPRVLGRAGWIEANLEGFRYLLRPLAEKLSGPISATGITRRIAGGAIGAQIGILLGYMSQKVLGQYDLVLASGGAPGLVYYVGPNIVETERRFGLNERDFRLWIALHEITHRTQFTGVPWLRARISSLIEQSLTALDLDPSRIKIIVERGRELLMRGPSAWTIENVMDIVLTDEQRALVGEVQALMSVVEGHGTFVMNRIGRAEIPDFSSMKDAIESRRRSARGPEKVFQRMLGIEMKYEQYVLGEKFCEVIAEKAGVDAVNKLWENEGENLPTPEEMRDPKRWLERVTA